MKLKTIAFYTYQNLTLNSEISLLLNKNESTNQGLNEPKICLNCSHYKIEFMNIIFTFKNDLKPVKKQVECVRKHQIG